jgi:hypothetical protein
MKFSSPPTSTEIHPLLHRIATWQSFDNDTHVDVRSCPRWYVTQPDQSTIWHHPLPIASKMDILDASISAMESAKWRSKRPDLHKCSLAMRFPTHLCNHPPQCRMRCRCRRICRRIPSLDSRVASILSRYSHVSRRRLASTVSSSSSSSSSLESSSIPESKLSWSSKIPRPRCQGTSVLWHHYIDIQVFETTTCHPTTRDQW